MVPLSGQENGKVLNVSYTVRVGVFCINNEHEHEDDAELDREMQEMLRKKEAESAPESEGLLSSITAVPAAVGEAVVEVCRGVLEFVGGLFGN